MVCIVLCYTVEAREASSTGQGDVAQDEVSKKLSLQYQRGSIRHSRLYIGWHVHPRQRRPLRREGVYMTGKHIAQEQTCVDYWLTAGYKHVTLCIHVQASKPTTRSSRCSDSGADTVNAWRTCGDGGRVQRCVSNGITRLLHKRF